MRSRTPALALAALLALTSCSAEPEGNLPSDDTQSQDQGGGEVNGAGSDPDDAPDSASHDGDDDAAGQDEGTGDGGTSSAEAPHLEIEVVADGLSIPWDVQLLPDGTALVGERGGRLLVIPPGGEPREVELELDGFARSGEGGLMGLAVSRDFEQDRTVWACHLTEADGGLRDVRVVRLLLDEGLREAEPDGVVVEGLPTTTGRHSGCRLLLSDDGQVLLVGTGDAANPESPQSPELLGGKVLAVSPDGDPLPGAPFVDGADPRVLTLGHRNVQGLAVQPQAEGGRADLDSGDPDIGVPGVGVVWSVEHGPTRDDEVNVLVPGANYGWDPGPGYDEGVPMTDLEAFPDAVEAVWSSGQPTRATSGAVFLEGPQWGAWEGALAVAELKGEGVMVLTVDGEEVTGEQQMAELDGAYGRVRSLTLDDEGALWVTTSNGHGNDKVLRVTASTGR